MAAQLVFLRAALVLCSMMPRPLCALYLLLPLDCDPAAAPPGSRSSEPTRPAQPPLCPVTRGLRNTTSVFSSVTMGSHTCQHWGLLVCPLFW